MAHLHYFQPGQFRARQKPLERFGMPPFSRPEIISILGTI
jgi:hypothetical protein